MDRKFAILLSICLGVVCAFVNWFANQSLSDEKTIGDQPIVVSTQQLLEEWPRDNFHLLLTDYQRGIPLATYDHDQDGNWELVYVPLFPAHLKSLGNNFNSVIVYFDDVKNEKELDARLASGELDSQLWYTQQKLPEDIHSDLANAYRLMDFSHCVVLQGGFDPPNKDVAKYAVLGSYLVILACGVVAVWNLVAMLLPKRRPHDFFNDEDEGPITNRAGLPDLEIR